LLCRVASQHDLADTFQLRSTEGWQNLQAILQSTGERIPKRPRERDDAARTSASSSALVPPARHPKLAPSFLSSDLPVHDSGEPIAKRFAAFRLNEHPHESNGASTKSPPR
jgi:nuclear protein localization protein 4 homolog